MKLVDKYSRMAALAALMSATMLAGCGGGGSDPVAAAPPAVEAPAPAPAPITGSAAGVLTDAAVGGVSFKTSSGVAGTTSATGGYTYNPGDTVEFKLGALSLGTVTATGIITPMELAGGSAAKLQNLLVLLQSLDTDGNLANGITVAAGSASAVSASVNLSGTTATFAADAGVQAAMTAGGVAGAPRTTTAANDHFKAQGLELLSRNIWVSQSYAQGTHTTVLRFNANGSYVHAEAGAADSDGETGLETGTIAVTGFSPTGFSLTSTVAYDANGDWGASDLQPCDTFRNSGVDLIIGDRCTNNAGTGQFKKMDNNPQTLVGAWEFKDADKSITFYFFADGRLLQIQALLVNGNIDSSGVYGGRYTLSASNFVAIGDGAQSGTTIGYTLGADGKTAVFDALSGATFTRISK